MEELLLTLIGTVMVYTWVHGSIIIGKKISGTTKYENVVLIVGLVGFALFVLGSL